MVQPSHWLRGLLHGSILLGNHSATAYSGMGDTMRPSRSWTCPVIGKALVTVADEEPKLSLRKVVANQHFPSRPCCVWWPQGYTGYLIPPRAESALSFAQHFHEVTTRFTERELLMQRLPAMEGAPAPVHDDVIIGAWLARIYPHSCPVHLIRRPGTTCCGKQIHTASVHSYSSKALALYSRYGPKVHPAMMTARKLVQFWQ